MESEYSLTNIPVLLIQGTAAIFDKLSTASKPVFTKFLAERKNQTTEDNREEGKLTEPRGGRQLDGWTEPHRKCQGKRLEQTPSATCQLWRLSSPGGLYNHWREREAGVVRIRTRRLSSQLHKAWLSNPVESCPSVSGFPHV